VDTRSVYCSGSIKKGSADAEKLCWTDVERKAVEHGARPSRVLFLNPDDPLVDPSNKLAQFGRDMYHVMIATAVVVDARQRRGIGVGVEMAVAASLGTPLIIVAPPNTDYRREKLEYRGAVVPNYVHPHVAALATSIVDDFASAGEALRELDGYVDRRRFVPAWLEPAIAEYERSWLKLDGPTREVLTLLAPATPK
jgi:hypothetical protein